MGLVQYIGQLRDNEVGILNCIAEIPKRRQRRHPKLKAPRYCLNNKGLETKVVLPKPHTSFTFEIVLFAGENTRYINLL